MVSLEDLLSVKQWIEGYGDCEREREISPGMSYMWELEWCFEVLRANLRDVSKESLVYTDDWLVMGEGKKFE